MDIIEIIIGLLIIAIGIIFYFKLKTKTNDEVIEIKNKDEELPYKKKEYIFSINEYRFYKKLRAITDEKNLIILTKMRLADVIEVEKGTKEYMKWFNYIKAKHIDFIICEKETVKPILLIELDDSSHKQEKRIQRDNFVDKILESVNIKILHIKNDSQQQMDIIKSTLP